MNQNQIKQLNSVVGCTFAYMLKVPGLTPEEDKYPFGVGSGRALTIKKKKKHCQIKHAKLLWRRHVNTETAESTFFGGGFPLKNKLNESHHTLMKVFTLG